MSIYDKIEETDAQEGLHIVVEEYLDSIDEKENSIDENYRETACRLRENSMYDEAAIMDYAEDQWWRIDRS